MRALAAMLLLVPVATPQDVGRTALVVEPLAPDPARDARIAELIDSLPAIDKAWHGISDTSGGGTAFDAIEAPEAPAPRTFRELVRLGPAAIPALLAHLHDERETGLSFRTPEKEGFGGMFERAELPAGSPAERALIVRALAARGVADDLEAPHGGLGGKIRDHVVTVGDCCLAILGQIVNRPYEAVRYQPTRITIVSSPTRDARIAKALRALWGRGDPRRILAESLQRDLAEGELDAGAALRLLAYFPDEAAPVVAGRIAAFPFEDHPEQGARLLRAAMSGGHVLVRAEWLKLLDPSRPAQAQLAAFAAAPSDAGDDFRERVRRIRDRQADVDVVAACIRALPGEESPSTFAWLQRELAKVEARDARRTQVILASLAALDEEKSLPIFLAHIEKLANWGLGNVLVALRQAPRPRLATALFQARLDRSDLVLPAPVPAPGWVTAETRWCDLAAAVLAAARPELGFDPKAPVEERDRQIAAIRAALAK
jgi:hypothetical protein